MFEQKKGLMEEIRSRFAHVEECPLTGKRIFFENAGGALTLNSVVETSAKHAAIPDNQGRDNPTSKKLVEIIQKSKNDAMIFFGAQSGQVFVGESGTELLFRIIASAMTATKKGGNVVGTTLEHPASRSAAKKWAEYTNKQYLPVVHNNETGSVTANDYAKVVNGETRLATIIHTSPVTGMGVNIKEITEAIRAVSQDCYIIVDGIQHAAHGDINVGETNIDGYVISPYKVFSRHGYGIAWISDRMGEIPHNNLIGGPETSWELGTRDVGAYATFSNVVDYLEWLGEQVSQETGKRKKIEAAGKAIKEHENSLTNAMINGVSELKGLKNLPIDIIGGINNPKRKGLISFNPKTINVSELIQKLEKHRIRVHSRKNDHYSSNVLEPLGLKSCVRVSMCHYNNHNEIKQFLTAMNQIINETEQNKK